MRAGERNCLEPQLPRARLGRQQRESRWMVERRQGRRAGRSGLERVVASMLPYNIGEPERGRNE